MARPARARDKILDAAITLVRRKGYAATSVEDVCREAGASKGAFFHHFPDKEAMAVAAARRWSEVTAPLFATAPYHQAPDAFARIIAYLDFRKAILKGDTAEFTCFAGTMAQEIHCTNPEIRAAVAASIFDHAATLEADFAAAMAQATPRAAVTARSLAQHCQAVLQGAFVLAKAQGGPEIAAETIDHLKRYLALLLTPEAQP